MLPDKPKIKYDSARVGYVFACLPSAFKNTQAKLKIQSTIESKNLNKPNPRCGALYQISAEL